MSVIEWIILGALLFAIMVFCARITSRGLTTLDDNRRQNSARIAEGKRQLAEDRKNMSASEHLTIIQAGLTDLLRLEDGLHNVEITRNGPAIEITTPTAAYEVELLMRERMLKSTHKVIHGRSVWVLRSDGIYEKHAELSGLMASLNAHLHGKAANMNEPEHIAKRLEAPHNKPKPRVVSQMRKGAPSRTGKK